MGTTHQRQVVVFIVLLLIPTVGLDDVARDHLHRHISRVNMHHTFKDAHARVVKRVMVRGLVMALFTNLMNLLFDMLFTCLKGDLLFTRTCDAALGPPRMGTSVLLRPSAFVCTLLFYFVLGFLDANLPT